MTSSDRTMTRQSLQYHKWRPNNSKPPQLYVTDSSSWNICEAFAKSITIIPSITRMSSKESKKSIQLCHRNDMQLKVKLAVQLENTFYFTCCGSNRERWGFTNVWQWAMIGFWQHNAYLCIKDAKFEPKPLSPPKKLIEPFDTVNVVVLYIVLAVSICCLVILFGLPAFPVPTNACKLFRIKDFAIKTALLAF